MSYSQGGYGQPVTSQVPGQPYPAGYRAPQPTTYRGPAPRPAAPYGAYGAPAGSLRQPPTPGFGSAQAINGAYGSGQGRQATSAAQQAPATTTQILQQRYAGQPIYNDQGSGNRLTLSLRCGLTEEVDFALGRLAEISQADPDLLPLKDLPGMLEALLSLIQDALVEHEQLVKYAHFSRAEPNAVIRRGLEAGLNIRNLVLSRKNGQQLASNRRLFQCLADILEAKGDATLPDTPDLTELKVYALDILEVIGSVVELVDPAKSRPEDPAARFFPVLVQLTQSSDRALVLAAFRALSVFAREDFNEDFFTCRPAKDRAVGDVGKSNIKDLLMVPLNRALELLPLKDADLVLAALEYVYDLTSKPANATLIVRRPDILAILRLLLARFGHGGFRETWQVENKSTATRMISYGPITRAEWFRDAGDTSLNPRELMRLLEVKEPQRAIDWMRSVFTSDEIGEVTQVNLWNAYRAAFEQFAAQYAMLPAADVIKHTTDAFPDAVPMVQMLPTVGADGRPEKKFVIKGIRPRTRIDLARVYACQWRDCKMQPGATPDQLYSHIKTHLYGDLPAEQSPQDHLRCQWSDCKFASSRPASTPLSAVEVDLHARTHILTGYQQAQLPPEPAAPTSSGPATAFDYTIWSAAMNDSGDLTGPALIAALIVRNLARSIRTAAVRAYSNTNDKYGNGISFQGRTNPEADQEQEQSEGQSEFKAIADAGRDALASLEPQIVEFCSSSRPLSQYCADILESISAVERLVAQ
ncbi:uncharacterized protein L969DRAFT_91553 [Mixia osmundae IAM 14324]|uniref:RFX-type winged-helix domain-containing protein n=1 Tax=Mixia osmundae (strain CBS 9802 / IAM 14324 / JCM 22182 / KY 12970) TaxID=764103 RepID=G7DV77_MIXOS|nr:uncharacterized protein L969DRAFT_91553 [Mixia osmundae IAM 14324]KEI42089.1 hypothetical protein L969DRAFT_91553 [Mixia osmundae IAM 14324]GAA94487.1 hypothetical protein E5Q_01139 [Mixia osmundae IAM 14324]